jgi:adenosylcobinamide-phosphate synthase
MNAKVPADYDGVTPNPVMLLQQFAAEEGFDSNKTVGLLTAASMETLRVASRSADGVVIDAVVTAGISNARRAGVDADYFMMFGDEDDKSTGTTPPGTINTVVITNAALTQGALVEAYAITVEAKCAACADLRVACQKSGQLAQGTGTDCTVLVSNNSGRKVQHAGKHTLFAEMVGQAVYEATREALLTNIYYMHGSLTLYTIRRWRQQVATVLLGARPCVPPRPMMPVPWAPASVVAVGFVFVVLAYISPLPHSARIVLAVVAWDRCLGEPPLSMHPVVVVGRLISFILKRTPGKVFVNPILGLLCGTFLLLFILSFSLMSTYLLMALSTTTSELVFDIAISHDKWSIFVVSAAGVIDRFTVFIFEVILVKSACSLQLLCTIALQMAKFLERRQLSEARSQLSWLCSRDPSDLRADELAGATLESLSENLSDGFVAPLFWFTFCGPLGAMGYRVVNTLDSRVGYRGKYEWFGKPSALFDDLLNLVPARFTALLLAFAALAVPGCNATNGLAVAWRDCSQCDSPNAGWPMGAMAGLLGVRLEKKGQYILGGKDTATPPGVSSIRLGQSVAQLAGGLAVVVAVLVCACVTK